MTIPPQNPAAHPPKKTALMLLDFHQLVVDMIQPQETQDRLCHDVQSLLKSARANGSPVIHAMMGFEQEPLARSKVRQTFESKYKPLLTSAPEKLVEWEGFTDNAAPASREITVYKKPGCVSALKTPELSHFLKEQHAIESVIICGVITSGAVLSTAREAADLGFTTTVVEEGCWDYAPETHDVVLHKILPMTAWVVKMETALKLLAGKSEALEDTK
ncbi:Isochorismatase-like protein [Akanthomyces lecanii RCEF 1005]|uniref:Isochorismatase-like protein n=1 Tax=Akanthomyces lecanii RCEF 1005 TaxID=1081108 RepID=A0A168CZZ0_CORDF|nr:Isochorismatase-like protein [Akanthomyces lecanii RCEF 1005]